MDLKTVKSWNKHYTRDSSLLVYPDEQLVRMIAKYCTNKNIAIDLGCGTGRHIKLLYESGFSVVVGADVSFNAISQCLNMFNNYFVQCSIDALPFCNSSFDAVIAWGSLHYSKKPILVSMLHEIKRILKPGGILFGTLRSSRDTYLSKGNYLGNNTWETSLPDIKGAIISLYSLDEVTQHLSIFSEYHIGLMERTQLDNLNEVISHWYFCARV